MDFRDRSVVVTGASTGIGQGLAVALAGRGARVTVAARRAEALAETVRRCEAAGGQAQAVPTDVTDPAACGKLVEAAVGRFGALDVLVCNAGVSMWARFDEITDLTVFDQLMRVNYLGAVYCTHFALPHLKKSRGLLVAVSSLTGKTGVPTRTGYAASKHALQGFFDSLRIELSGSGVDVLVVSPGFVATEVRASAFGPDGKPLGQSPRKEDRNTMSVEACVQQMMVAMAARRRELVMPGRARMVMLVKALAPRLVDRIAAAEIRRR
jgi:NAD(P)-dependent dehydrogenase (short-subunit alcohol dehydrogenase family)